MWEGFLFYGTIEAFMEAGFILLMSWKQWTGQYTMLAQLPVFTSEDLAQQFFIPLQGHMSNPEVN